MGLIGRFIDDACARRPALMACVLQKEFGPLGEWITWESKGPCGCLIGTIALCAKDSRPSLFTEGTDLADEAVVEGKCKFYVSYTVAGTAIVLYAAPSEMFQLIEDVGVKVSLLADWLERHADYEGHSEVYEQKVVTMLKARIRRALARAQAQLEGQV